MDVTQAQLERVKRETLKNISLYTRLVAEKRHIKENYGYEEQGEEVAKYQKMLDFCLDQQNKIENGFFKVII